MIDFTKLDKQEALNIIDDYMKNQNEKNNIILLNYSDNFFAKMFGNNEIIGIFISQNTLLAHKHHDNLIALDYYQLREIAPLGYTKSTKKLNHYKVFYNNKEYYKAIYKITKKNEVFLVSLTKGSSIFNQIKSEIKKGTLQEP